MSDFCGVCTKQPPKYKCPSCDVRYCSIGCFKEHKTTHEESTSQKINSNTLPSVDTQPVLSEPSRPNAVPAPHNAQSSPFSGLLTDPAFNSLFQTHPNLRSQLRGVYMTTQEPDPDAEPRFPASRGYRGHRGNFRGRGRGRGRGDGRPRGPWRQENADKWAVDRLMRLQSRDGPEAEGIQEFVRLIANFTKQDDGEIE
ncbi:hypothetical protein K490DRAFT_36233 [Saccharata proteae CBS 121410]|uniref:HIT-type domain-containing protein n=1 Tax=Saccharata proteae CBS 121410 TaxID=1314787 RepID=A0A9P4HYG2_9PEZI|nr:hypothetical protein K490DRAFT_36233 [Saccharata proteae CBS 121410]